MRLPAACGRTYGMRRSAQKGLARKDGYRRPATRWWVRVVAPPNHSNRVRVVEGTGHSGIVDLIRGVADGTELSTQFSANGSSRRCLLDAIFRTTHNEAT